MPIPIRDDTPIDHFREAQRLLEPQRAGAFTDADTPCERDIAAAQVHAILELVAVLGPLARRLGTGVPVAFPINPEGSR